MPSWKDRATKEDDGNQGWKSRARVEENPEIPPTALEDALGVFNAPSIGERIPIIGPLAAKAGTAVAAGLMAPFSDKTFGELYNESTIEDEKRKAIYAKKYPVANVAQDVFASAALPAPGAGTAVMSGAGKLAKGVNAAAGIGRKATINYGAAEADSFLRGGPEGSGNFAAGATVGTELLPKAIKPIAKGIRKYSFGVTDKLAEAYAKRAPFINKESEALLKADVDAVISGLKNKTSAAKDAYSGASLSGRTAQQIETMRLAQTQPGIDKAAELVDAAKDLRLKISQQSSTAFDVLQDSGELINMDPVKQQITSRMKSLKIGDQVPPANTASGQQYQKLQTYRDFLDNVAPPDAPNIEPIELKKFIQMLDAEIDSAFDAARASGYVTKGDRSLIETRQDINKYLYEIPGYSSVMKPLAEDTRLLKGLNESFETEAEALKTLKNISKPENRQTKALVGELQKKSGKDFLSSVGEYERAQSLLKDPVRLQQHLDSLPSSQKTKELLTLYEAAKQKAKDVTGGVSEKGSQSLIRRVGSDTRNDIEGKKVLSNIGKEGGQDFIQRAEDLAAKRALEQGFTRGSRNVNLGSASLAGLVGAVSQKLAPQGGALGAIAGAMADIVGPQTYKKIVDLSMTPKFQRYAKVLEEAAARGPLAAAVAHNNLLKSDQDYRRMMSEK